MNKDSLIAKNVEKHFRLDGAEVSALRGVDLTIKQGEFVAIVGPSGCGKSTLLNILGGLTAPTRGEVAVEGIVLTHAGNKQIAQLRRHSLGFIFQNFNLSPYLTAQENVEFPMVLAGVSASERSKRAVELLGEVGLLDKLEFFPEELSGGQKQRVAIARALTNRPKVLLADEPTGNLDSGTAKQIIDLLTSIQHQQSLTLVMVTHEQSDAERADRIISMNDGLIDDKAETAVSRSST